MHLRILIVDDSETMRRLSRAIAGSRQWTVCGEAEDGDTGIKQYEKLQPDLVLIDLALPDINGLEVAKRISALNSKVPLVLFTVLDVEGLEEAARAAGVCQVVSKAQIWNLISSIENAVTQYSGPARQSPDVSG